MRTLVVSFALLATPMFAGAQPALTAAPPGTTEAFRGTTNYLRVFPAPGIPAEGDAVFVFLEEGRAIVRLPNGFTMRGPYRLSAAGYCVDWENGPRNSCSNVMRRGEQTVLVNPADGQVRSLIVRSVSGNPEGLR